MCALEIVSDRKTKTAIDKPTIGKISQTAYECGAIIRVSGNNIILSPPLIISEDEINALLTCLREGFHSI